MEALAPLASVTDLERRLRRTFESASDRDWAESVLNEASDVVRAESGKDWTGAPAPRIVWTITLRVADRAIRNPDGYSAETASDYSYQRNGVGADGGLFLTPWERKMLGKAAGKSGLWTQQVTRGEDYDDTLWLEDSFGLELFPVDSADGFY